MNATELRAHYRAVRARLTGGVRPVAIDPKTVRPVAPLPPPAPEPKPAPQPVRVTFIEPVCRPPVAKAVARGTIRTVIRTIEQRTGVGIADLKGTSRKKPIVEARQRLAYALFKQFALDRLPAHERPGKMSLPRIAQILGGRDNTTILHSVRREAERRQIARGR